MGLFDSVKRGVQRFSDPLTPSEMNYLLDGRQQSDLSGYFLGQIYAQRTGWSNGLLTIFKDGSGSVYFDSRSSSTSNANNESYHHFWREEYWDAGKPTNNFGDPTPLLIGTSETPFERGKRYIPSSTPTPSPGEMILAFELFTNDYDDDGTNSWVSGASHKPGTVFVGIVLGTSAAILRQRCEGRRGW